MAVVDVITELTYNANTDVLELVNREFGTQIKNVKQLQAENEKLQNTLGTLAKDDIKNRQILNALYEKNKKAIEDINFSIGKQLGLNKNLSKTIVDATGNLRNLSFAGSQLLREAPAFTYSIQTGILALSNNIPILIDQLEQARKSGSTTKDIFVALGQSVFSFSGLITIAVTALTYFGGKLFDTDKALKENKKTIDDVTKSLDEYSKMFTNVANKNNEGSNQLKRDLELIKARGVVSGNVLEYEKQVFQAEQALRKQESKELDDRIKVYERVGNAIRLAGASQNGAGRPVQISRLLRGLPEQERQDIEKAFASGELTARKFNERIEALYEKRKDLRNADLVGEAQYNAKIRSENEKTAKELDELTEIKNRIDELARSINRLDSADLGKFGDELEKAAKKGNKEMEVLLDNFRKLEQRLYGSSLSTNEATSLNTQLSVRDANNELIGKSKKRINEEKQAQLEADRERAKARMDILRQEYQLKRKEDPESYDTQEAGRKFKEARQQYNELNYDINDSTRAAIDAAAQGYMQLASTVGDVLNQIYDRQLSNLDRQISATQERISLAVELAKAGNASVLQEEINRLDTLNKKREEIAEKQLQTNSALQASSSAIAAAQAIQVVTNAGATGDPYTTAARIAAAVAALAAGFAFVTSLTDAFADGVVDYQGKGTAKSDSNLVRISKGESVITAEATQKYKPMLAAMNAGTFTAMPVTTQGVSRYEMDGVHARLDTVIDVLSQSRTNVNFNATPDGIAIMTQTAIRRNQNRFR